MTELIVSRLQPASVAGKVATTIDDPDFPGEFVASWEDPSGGTLALDDLTDVDTTTTPPSDGDVLTYDNASSLWVPAAPTGGGGSPTFVGVKAYRSAALSLTSGSAQVIAWDAEEWDTDGFHDTVTNNSRLTVPSGLGGKYELKAHLTCVNPFTARAIVLITKNGATATRFGRAEGNYGTGRIGLTAIAEVDLVATDYIEATFLYVGSGSQAIDLTECFFSLRKIG